MDSSKITPTLLSLAMLSSVALGSAGLTSDLRSLLCLVAGAIILGATIWRFGIAGFQSLPVTARIFAVGVVLLYALQLVPLPPELWRALPNRNLLEGAVALVGADDRWRPISVDPLRTTWLTLALAFPAATFLIAVSDPKAAARYGPIAVAATAIGVLSLGAAQLALGSYVGLTSTPPGFEKTQLLLGTFPNRNHTASYLILGVVCSIYLVRRLPRHRRMPIGLAAFCLFGAGVLATQSRTGAVVYLLTAGAALFIFILPRSRRSVMAASGIVVAAGLAIVAIGATGRIGDLGQRAESIAEDSRWEMWPRAARVAGLYWPVGSGLGTFEAAYEIEEPLAGVDSTQLNRAHNEYLELVLEAGFPGVLLAVFGLFVLGQTLLRGVYKGRSEAKLAALVFSALALHSLVDYPLQRPAIMSVAGLFLGLALVSVERGRRSTDA